MGELETMVHGFLNPSDSPPQTESQLSQPFYQNSLSLPMDGQNNRMNVELDSKNTYAIERRSIIIKIKYSVYKAIKEAVSLTSQVQWWIKKEWGQTAGQFVFPSDLNANVWVRGRTADLK